MKKAIITLIITILVFVVTLIITNRFIANKSIETADTMVASKLDDFRSDFDYDLQMTKNAVYSFLTGNFTNDTTGNSGCFYVDESNRQFFEADLKKHLKSFLKANPYYYSAMFIIETDSTKPLSQKSYYAPLLTQKSDTLSDIAQTYDFSHSNTVEKCKSSLKPYWILPSEKSTVSKKVVTFTVPICRKKDGSFFGLFSLGLSTKTIDEDLESHLPYPDNHSEMLLLSENEDIISSYPIIYKKAPSYMSLENSLKNLGKEYTDNSVEGKKIFSFDGKEYFQYERKLKNAPWKIVTVCCSSAVYDDAYYQRNIILITSLTGMLMMLIACVVIFRQIHRTYREKMSAEHEINMASKVQMSLLKKRKKENTHVSINAFIQPAREAGGDLYDYAEVDGKQIFCIGDVSGKGMPAALFMTQVVSLFRSAIKRTTDPSAIVSSINEVLSDNNPDMTFCTLFVATLEGANLTYCNAGHNKPVLLPCTSKSEKASVNTPALLDVKPNIAIGLVDGYPYKSQSLTFEEGNALLLYTDGVTEAKNKVHNMYGEQQMLTTLSSRESNNPEHITTLLVSSVTSFVDGAEQSDDITLLAIKRN